MELDPGLPGGSWANALCGCCRSSSRISRDLMARQAAKHKHGGGGHPGGGPASPHAAPYAKHLHGIAFGAVMLASSALNNLFVTYHLDFYLTVVGVSPAYFYLGHCIFMIWNATNDVVGLGGMLPCITKPLGRHPHTPHPHPKHSTTASPIAPLHHFISCSAGLAIRCRWAARYAYPSCHHRHTTHRYHHHRHYRHHRRQQHHRRRYHRRHHRRRHQ